MNKEIERIKVIIGKPLNFGLTKEEQETKAAEEKIRIQKEINLKRQLEEDQKEKENREAEVKRKEYVTFNNKNQF